MGGIHATNIITDDEAREAAKRLRDGSAARGVITPPPSDEAFLKDYATRGNLVVTAGTDGVMLVHLEDGAWWATHVYGTAMIWRTLFKKGSQMLVDMGQGSVPIRFSLNGPVADVARQAVQPRQFRTYQETTANEVVARLP